MRVAVIGAAGGVGSRLCRILTERGDEAVGVFRRAEQAEIVSGAGAAGHQFDLVDGSDDDLEEILEGCDAVVFTAGAHGTGEDQTTLIDGKGLEKALRAAQEAKVYRVVVVSAMPEAARGRETTPSFEHYMRTKKRGDIIATTSGLDWVVVRPGRLTNDDGNGRVTAGLAVEYGEIPRDDVALFLAEVVRTPELSRAIVEVTRGPETVQEAVGTVVELLNQELP
ncbi:SDR family oxidoreductase [Zhihengliuella sp.]|uniref:NAD(P)-binding oxidoreductase n=1 Tax=Zhihengliuella sp. TaxID=1954483 RepID=UPI002810EE89|nr:SDR family oxidoreductase [Zhihengliuella sp.]